MIGAYAVLGEPPARAIGRILGAWSQGVARRIALVGGHAADEALTALRLAHPDRKLVLYYWQRDVPTLFVVGATDSALGRTLRAVGFVCDETLGGRVSAELLRRLGGGSCLLRRRDPMARLRDLARIMRAPEPIGIAVDGHGPYGTVGPEFPRFLRSSRALAVPFAGRASHAASLRVRAWMRFPRPGARLSVVLGEAIDGELATGDLRTRLEEALDRACSDAARALGLDEEKPRARGLR